jgi:hypothetical protein
MKQRDGVHARKRGQHSGALAFRHDRTPRAFEPFDGAIAIKSDDQDIPKSLGALQECDMPHM